MSFAFRPKGRAWFSVVDGFRGKPHRWGQGGALVADERGAGGIRLMAWPAYSVVAVEGRLGALLAGDVDDHSLAPASALVDGAVMASDLLSSYSGADVGRAAEVRRVDLASELRFGAGSDGLAFLRTVAGMAPARLVTDVWRGADGQPQTVYRRTPKRGVVLDRIYDKGVESGSHAAGLRLRIENQQRPAKSKRVRPDVLSTSDLKGVFGRTMNPYLLSSEVLVAGPDGAVAELAARAIRGELTHAKAERLIGSVALLKHGGRAVYDRDGDAHKVGERRSNRRLKALRDAGVVLSDELPAESVVPVSQLLRDAIERFSA